MKKIITYLLIVLNICSLTACKKSDVNSNISTLASSQSQTTSEVASQESSSVEIVSSNSSTTNKQSSKTEKTDTSQPQKTPQESSSDSNTSSYVSSTQSVTSYTEEELIEINKKRPDYDLGTCRKLEGTVSVLLFYMYDFESDWTHEQMDEFTVNEVMPGLEFIEEQAKEYGINLKLQIERIYLTPYFGKVITNANESITVTANVLEAAAKGINYNTPEEMIDDFERMIKTEVVCFTIFNKKGTSNAINPPRGSEYEFEEHCVIFSQDLESDGASPLDIRLRL
jgi:hypothetical protein